MSATVGELNIEVQLQLGKIQAQFDQLSSTVQRHTKTMEGYFKDLQKSATKFFEGLVSVEAIKGLADYTKSIIENAAELKHSADAARVSSESFQVLNNLAKSTGVDINLLTRGLDTMEKKIADAAAGVKSAQEPFEKLGLNVKDLQTLAPEKQFEALARAVNNANDPTVAFRSAVEILGAKSAPRLLEALKQLGEQGFDELAKKEKAAGLVMSDSVVAKLDEIEKRLGMSATKSKNYLGTLVAESTALTDSITDVKVRVDMLTTSLETLKERNAQTLNNNYATDIGITTKELEKQKAKLDELMAKQEAIDERQAQREAHKRQMSEDTSRYVMAQAQAEADFANKMTEGRIQMEAEGYGMLNVALEQHRAEIDKTWQSKNALMALTENPVFNMPEFTAPTISKKDQEEALRLTEATRTELEIYEEELYKINKLEKEGAIDTDTAQRAKKMALDDYNNTLKEQQDLHKEAMKMANELSKSLANTFVNGIEKGDRFSQILKGIAMDLEKAIAQALLFKPLESGIESMLTGGLGGGSGGLFTSLFSALGFRASGGPVSMNQPYVVGENGPEVIVPSQSGTVIPNSALGGSNTNFNQSFNFASGVTKSDLASMLPHLVNQVQAAVAESVRRGGPYSQVFGGA